MAPDLTADHTFGTLIKYSTSTEYVVPTRVSHVAIAWQPDTFAVRSQVL